MKRKCILCGKRLSIYNKSDRCFHHGVDMTLGKDYDQGRDQFLDPNTVHQNAFIKGASTVRFQEYGHNFYNH